MSVLAKSPLAWVVLIVLLFTYAYFIVDPGWNGWSHMALVRALVEDHTTRIDHFHQNTEDKSYFQGHYYSDKAPGLSLLAAPAYAAYLQGVRLRFGVTEAARQVDARPDKGLYFSTLAAVGLPSAMTGAVLFSVCASLTHDAFKALMVTAAYGLGSLAFPFSTVFFSHQLSGSLLFAAFALLFYERRREVALRPPRWRWPVFFAGLATGYSVVTEYSAAVPTLLLGVYAATAPSTRRTLLAFLGGGLVAAGILVIYNWISFRTPFTLGYLYLVNPEFRAGMGTGFMGLTHPKLGILYQTLFGFYRGLVPLSPVTVVAAIGGWRMWKERSVRPELLLAGSIVAFYLLFNASYFFWDGGRSFGPRHIVSMLAFLNLPIAFGIGPRPLVAGGLLGLSVLHMLLGTTFRPLVPSEVTNTLLDYIYPKVFHGFVWDESQSRNWGMILGFHGPWVLLPLLLVWTGAAIVTGVHISKQRYL